MCLFHTMQCFAKVPQPALNNLALVWFGFGQKSEAMLEGLMISPLSSLVKNIAAFHSEKDEK